MTTLFQQWLIEHRSELLARWHALAAAPVLAMSPSEALLAAAPGVPANTDEQNILLDLLYEAMISAAGQDMEPLHECLRHVRILRTQAGEAELPFYIGLMLQLRRAAWDRLNEPDQRPSKASGFSRWATLVEQLDLLVEQATVELSAHWSRAAERVQHELNETKLLVESLYHDAEATDRTTLQVSNLNTIAQGLAATMDRTQQLAIVGEQLHMTLEVACISIWLYDAPANALTLAHHWHAETFECNAVPEQPQISLHAADDMLVQTFSARQVLFDEAPSGVGQGFWYQPGFAIFAAPMLAQGQAIGVIALQDPDANTLSDRSQQDFVMSVASQSAIALESTRLYNEVLSFNSVLEQRIAERTKQLQMERDTLETVNQIAIETSSTLEHASLIEASLNALAKLVNVQYGSIMLVDPELDQLIDGAVLGRSNDRGFTRFPIGEGIAGWVAQNKRPAVIADVLQDPRWVTLPEMPGSPRKTSGSLLAVPLIAHHQVLGVLQLSHENVGYFNDDHLRLLSASAGQIAIGINNAQLYTELEKELMHRSEMFQRQEAEASQSQAILQSLSDGVIVCGEDGSVLTANMACERILERSIEELVIWNLPELLRRLLGRRADEVPVEELLAHPIDTQRQPRSFATVFQMGTRTVSVTLGPVLNSKESLLGVVALFRDTTREVESDRLKTEFIGTVSHELRTPMTSIKGFTQLLSMGSLGPVNDTQKEFLQIIQSNAERMISIINDLLDITKIETGSVEIDLRPLHMAEAISTVLLDLQTAVHARDLELSITIPPGLPLVLADGRRLNQILGNVLSNAVKYTPRGGQIVLDAREIGIDDIPAHLHEGLKPKGRYALVEVRDTGVGIAPEELERIFERFYRTENPLKVEAGGTGLGLSLVRPLIKLFGGRIWVESKLGEGSTFSLVVPAA